MSAPLIAVTGRRLPPGRVAGWRAGALAVPDAYVEAVRRSGGIEAVVTPAPLDEGGARHLLERFDGLLLTGGGDIHPRRYGEVPGPAIYGVDEERDALELELARAAAETALPTLAICRGIQVLNVALGGTLEQDLRSTHDGLDHGEPSLGEERVHDVWLEPRSRVAEAMGVGRASCVSHHHQAVAKIGERLIATGWSDDGLVEVLEHEDGWVVGVQWHPEMSCGTDPVQQRLFEALVRRARTANPRPAPS